MTKWQMFEASLQVVSLLAGWAAGFVHGKGRRP